MFIELTPKASSYDGKFYLNPSQIECYRAAPGGGSLVWTMTGEPPFELAESPQEISGMIRRSVLDGGDDAESARVRGCLHRLMEANLLNLDGDYIVGYDGNKTDDRLLYQELLWAADPFKDGDA